MAGGVATSSSYLQSGIKVCDVCISSLSQAASSLNYEYHAASLGWKDEQYARLGQIVGECYQSLTKPISSLGDCRASLEKLISAIRDYEQLNVVSSQSGGNSSNSGVVSGGLNQSVSENDAAQVNGLYDENETLSDEYKDCNGRYVRDTNFLNSDGSIAWRTDTYGNGFKNPPVSTRIEKGTILQRYGGVLGRNFAPDGTPFEMLSLPYVQETTEVHYYRVIREIPDTLMGEVAPDFDQPGGGVQYETPLTIWQLIQEGYIEEIF